MSGGNPIIYTDEELLFVKSNSKLPRKQLLVDFQTRFNRPRIRFHNLNSLCKRKGWKTGRDGRFVASHKSWNKGKKIPSHPNCIKTQFKKGCTPNNIKYLGHERIDVDGYVKISILKTNPHTGYHRMYIQKHKYLWEKINGKVPKGHCLRCLDADRANTNPDNWMLVSRAQNVYLTRKGYTKISRELQESVLLAYDLSRAVSQKIKQRTKIKKQKRLNNVQ